MASSSDTHWMTVSPEVEAWLPEPWPEENRNCSVEEWTPQGNSETVSGRDARWLRT